MPSANVDLTLTHASNTASNASNAESDDGSVATVSAAGRILYRYSGAFVLSEYPGAVITKVEVVAEVTAITSGSGGQHYLASYWSGSIVGSSLEFTTTGVARKDVTADRAWQIEDFAADPDLEARTEMIGGGGIDGHQVDYLRYEIEFDIAGGGAALQIM